MKQKLFTVASLALGYATLYSTRAYSVACDITGGAQSGANCAQGTNVPTSLNVEVQNITNLLLTAIGVISVIMIIIGGIRYAVSGGDDAGVKSAKDTILYAVIGVVVALLAYAIVNFVLDRFI
ncbi:MAG: hypothetical protein QG675_74 [Patescibacteria group bacterium]|jgi:hypothetical protein|nr:hypothetical protein [Patescibacteria group bacterium]